LSFLDGAFVPYEKLKQTLKDREKELLMKEIEDDCKNSQMRALLHAFNMQRGRPADKADNVHLKDLYDTAKETVCATGTLKGEFLAIKTISLTIKSGNNR
jgi:hypothetical protein